MISLIALALMQNTEPQEHVIAASIFKNNYALLVREVPVKGSGEITLTDLPHPAMGTFWISASDGVEIEDIVHGKREGTYLQNADSFAEVLERNVGKIFRLSVSDPTKPYTVEGKLLSFGKVVILDTAEGTVVVPADKITNIISPNSKLDYVCKYASSTEVVNIHVKATKPGSIYLMGLESGLNWAPAYSLDVSDGKNVKLIAKATVTDNLAELKDIDTQFVTGVPNAPWINLEDPFFSSGNQGYSGGGGGGGGGGYGNTGNTGNQNINRFQNTGSTASKLTSPMEDLGLNVVFTGDGNAKEDLFFYEHPHVSLTRGDKGYYILFKEDVPYKDVYTLDLGYGNTGEVWHNIDFTNSGKEPLTTGPASVFKNGQIVGQDTINYTSENSKVRVKVAQALDVHSSYDEVEVSRDKNALVVKKDKKKDEEIKDDVYDVVTYRYTLHLQNLKSKPVSMEISKNYQGVFVSADPKIHIINIPPLELTAYGHIDWTTTLAPQGKDNLSFVRKVYVKQP